MNRKIILLKTGLTALVILIGLLLFVAANAFLIPEIQDTRFRSLVIDNTKLPETSDKPEDVAKLQKQVDRLEQKLDRLTPGGTFLIINTTENTYRLFKNNQIIRKGLCSTGSLIQLEVDSTKSFTFETPRGALSVKGKITNPIWRKPDWAFIEEGLPVPPANHNSRFERGVLGDYALSLGDGYLIHGTLYQRLLGMPVTHGCIRLADEDLEVVYKNLQVGSKVFIY